MKHTHHIIPKHMGGTDDASNLIELSVEEHAEAHRVLWEEHGNIYDKVAWMSLSNQMSLDSAQMEAKREGVRRFHTGRKRSEETRRKISEAQKGKANKGTFSSGYKWSEDSKKAFSESLKGKKRGSYKKFKCHKCGAVMAGGPLKRWHGDKCTR